MNSKEPAANGTVTRNGGTERSRRTPGARNALQLSFSLHRRTPSTSRSAFGLFVKQLGSFEQPKASSDRGQLLDGGRPGRVTQNVALAPPNSGASTSARRLYLCLTFLRWRYKRFSEVIPVVGLRAAAGLPPKSSAGIAVMPIWPGSALSPKSATPVAKMGTSPKNAQKDRHTSLSKPLQMQGGFGAGMQSSTSLGRRPVWMYVWRPQALWARRRPAGRAPPLSPPLSLFLLTGQGSQGWCLGVLWRMGKGGETRRRQRQVCQRSSAASLHSRLQHQRLHCLLAKLLLRLLGRPKS